MSRGALYHHFASKQALFEAVVNALEARVGEAIFAAAAAGHPEAPPEDPLRDPAAGLRAAFLEWVGLAAEPLLQSGTTCRS